VVTLDWERDSLVEVGRLVSEELGVDVVPEELLTVSVKEANLGFTGDDGGSDVEDFILEAEYLEVPEAEELGAELEPEEIVAEIEPEELGDDEFDPADDEGEDGEGGWMKEG
jgi:hypothetical protein